MGAAQSSNDDLRTATFRNHNSAMINVQFTPDLMKRLEQEAFSSRRKTKRIILHEESNASEDQLQRARKQGIEEGRLQRDIELENESRLLANEKLVSIRNRLTNLKHQQQQAFPSVSFVQVEQSRQSVAECYQQNQKTPLNCSAQVQQFFDSVKLAQMEYVDSS